MDHTTLSPIVADTYTVSPILRRILHGCGTLLAIVGLAFAILRLHAHTNEIDLTHFDGAAWLIVAGLALMYGLLNLLLALAWRSLLTNLGAPVTIGWTIKTYGISQIAKYLPGNIFHLAGRQALGLAIGLPGSPLAKSAVWELGLITITGALFSGLALPLLIDRFSTIASIVLFLMILSGSTALLWRIAGQLVALAVVYYAMFLVISGALFAALVDLGSVGIDQPAAIVFPVIGAYVLAWLAGLVTPSAPAGIGVREIVLLILLNGLVSQAGLLLAVLLGRLVTVGGDMVFLGIALAICQPALPNQTTHLETGGC